MKKINSSFGVIVLLVSFIGYSGVGVKSAEAGKDTPDAPTQLKLLIVPNGFQLTWNLSPQDPGMVTGYEIVRSDRASGPFERVATVEKQVAQFVDTTASKEVIYYYKVRAIAEHQSSVYSNTVTGER